MAWVTLASIPGRLGTWNRMVRLKLELGVSWVMGAIGDWADRLSSLVAQSGRSELFQNVSSLEEAPIGNCTS